jgi:23S rRNA-intervening sequence protein
MKAKSYRDLEIYQLSFEHAMKIHKISLKLPKYEFYEEGRQLRESSKGVTLASLKGMEEESIRTISSGF